MPEYPIILANNILDGATLSGLSRRLGSPKSSLLYLLRPMTRLGYLARSPDGHYRLGPAAFTRRVSSASPGGRQSQSAGGESVRPYMRMSS